MKKSVLFLALFGSLNFVMAQAPEIKWQKTIGGAKKDNGAVTLVARNGNYIVGGTTESTDGDINFNHGKSDIFFGEMDTLGNWIWKKVYGGSSTDYLNSVIETDDGGFVLLGTTNSNDGDVSGNHDTTYYSWDSTLHKSDIWMLRLDDLGNILWQKCYGGSRGESASKIINTKDSGYAFIGSAYSNDGDVTNIEHSAEVFYSEVWITKLDGDGNIIWDKIFGSTADDWGFDILQSESGYFYVLGYMADSDYDGTGNHGKGDAWVAKMNNSGELIWSKLIGGSKGERLYSFMQDDDKNFILVGHTESNDGDVSGNHGGDQDGWVVKLDSSAYILWQKCLGGSGVIPNSFFINDESFFDVIQDKSGNYILGGSVVSNDGDVSFYHGGTKDAWITSLSETGELLWEKTFGGANEDLCTSIQGISEKEILFSGHSNSNDQDIYGNHGDFDLWLVKLDKSLVLPLQLLSFSANHNGKTNLLKWSTAQEINTDRFEIQRSSNSRDFVSIGNVKSLNNGKAKNDYAFTDAQPLKAVNYYRLKLLDKDGRFTYSAIKNVNNNSSFDVVVYPNPVRNSLTLNFNTEKAMDVQIEIVNAAGKKVYANKLQLAYGASLQSINVVAFAAGNYFVKCTTAEGQTGLKFVKQ